MSPFLLYALGVATGIMCALPKLWPWSWIGIAIIGVMLIRFPHTNAETY